MNKKEEIKKVEDAVAGIGGNLADMRREGKYFSVPGEGSHDASIMLIGEAPGAKEAGTGRPFVGRAGKILDELLASVAISREEVFITSIVKDRPPKNRDPLPEEIALYAPFLDKQIEIIKPKVIATLGRFSMQYVMERYGLAAKLESISELHGQVFDAEVGSEAVKVVALFHPAAAIYNQKLKPILIEDFKVLKGLI